MKELDPAVEQQLADLCAEDFDALILRTRPPEESADPKARAAQALRREMGANRRGTRPTKQAAADALRQYAQNR